MIKYFDNLMIKSYLPITWLLSLWFRMLSLEERMP